MNPFDKLTFSKDQQQALLGHAISEPAVYEQCRIAGVTAGWYFLDHAQRLWDDLGSFHERYSRHPGVAEFQSSIHDEKNVEERLRLEVDAAIKAKDRMGLDALLDQLKEWAASQEIAKQVGKLEQTYNKGEIWPCKQLISDLHLRLDQIETLSGTTNRIELASNRARLELTERLKERRPLQYGVGVLDDGTGGIANNDLIVVGAKTGVGKTELVKQMAMSNAIKGVRVAFFALEAEDHEIERRIKYQHMVEWYLADQARRGIPVPYGKVNYADWRHGDLKLELGPYEDDASGLLEEQYKTLSTFYRTRGEFNVRTMERAITRAASSADLIVLDHLHYVDTEGDNDNAEMKAIVKILRDLALVLCKPIIVVAHLRKSYGGKGHPLVPTLEDFHGSSDIIKIATTAILLAPAFELTVSSGKKDVVRSWPTYIRLGKFRLDGSRTRYTGVGFFDPHSNSYLKDYALGTLKKHETNWAPVEDHKMPFWAKSASVIVQATQF